MKENHYDVIIIGGGPGGYTAALYCARAELRTLVLEKLTPGGQIGTTDMIDNYPGFPEGINGFDLGMQIKAGADRFGVETQLLEAKEIDFESAPKVVKTGKEVFTANTIILATGAAPKELGLPNERALRGRGLSYCATCDGMFFKGKTVVIVGGGNTAISDAVFLAKICKKVYIVHRRDELRASKIYIKTLEEAKNIEFIWDSEVIELIEADKLTGVVIRNKKTTKTRKIDCEGVFLAVGNVPNSTLFSTKIVVDEEGYVLADETTKTNIDGVFAVGDLRKKPLRQVVTAISDGAVASKFVEEYMVLNQL